MDPKVTVCVPTYNGERYLRPCLDSILCQTYRDFELLLVDDCSQDSTPSILDEYANRDPRIRVVRNTQNHGLAGNWNNSITLARGEWIKFVFQDDLIKPDCLEAMISAKKQGDLFLACSRQFEFESQTTTDLKNFYFNNKYLIDQLYLNQNSYTGLEFADLAVDRIGDNLIGEPTVTLIHKSVFERLGGFNENLIMSCDLEYWTRTGIHAGVRFVPEELVIFRVHSQAMSATNRRDRQYRMMVLDNLLIWHDVVNHPVYKPLRDAAKKHAPKIALSQLLERKSHIARIIAQHGDSLCELPQGTLMREWEKFIKSYPRLHVGGLRHWFWRTQNRSACKAARKRINFIL